jgi:CRISPR-associated protein Cmr4
MITQTLYIYTETPLHAGAGAGLSSIDLPIQRERTTQYPMIQGSGIKGKLRACLEGERANLTPAAREMVDIVFGPPSISGAGSEYAGALTAGDARILLFPVRSLNGVFAYTTSYDVLSRFKRDIERAQTVSPIDWDIPARQTDQALVPAKSDVCTNNTIVLEEFSFEARVDSQVGIIANWIATNALPDLGAAYWPEKINSSFVLLPNDVFRDFVLYATEVITRVRIDRKTKTVENGALWTEEHLPTDTLLYVPLYANKGRKKHSQVDEQQVLDQIAALNNTHLQLGGDETVGRGIVRIRLQ